MPWAGVAGLRMSAKPAHLLGASKGIQGQIEVVKGKYRKQGHILCGDYMGSVFPYSLLYTTKPIRRATSCRALQGSHRFSASSQAFDRESWQTFIEVRCLFDERGLYLARVLHSTTEC